jgi:glycosyltransferase involved in cell wall biosynthesis
MEVSKGLTELGDVMYVLCRWEGFSQKRFEEIQGIRIFRMARLPALRASRSLRLRKRHDTPRSFLERLYRVYLGFIHLFYATYFVVRIIRKYNIDVIMERSSSLGCGTFAGFITSRPVVLEVNDPVYNRASLRIARKIIATSEKLIPNEFRNKLKVVTWGVNTALFNRNISGEAIREKLGLINYPVVLFVGSFADWHGLDDLIQAGRAIVRELPHVRFMVVGGGKGHPNYKRIVDKAQKLGLLGNFLFVGTVDYREIPNFIAASDVAVAPYDPRRSEYTRKYGFFYSPLKIFEYMAVGKPVVATRVENVSQIIENGVDGLLVEPGDYEELAQAILKLLKSSDLAKQLGDNAYLKSKNYSWEKHCEMLNGILLECIRRR